MRLPTRSTGLLALALAPALTFGGPTAQADDVVLVGGSRLTGVVLERTPERVRLLLPSGTELDLAAADVKEVAPDADPPTGTKFVRYTGAKEARRQGLETALVHYVHPQTGRRVDLVGAVHIGDMAYYREVQRALEAVDLVLYELVKSKDEKPEAKDEDGEANVIRSFQTKLATWFGLAFQMDGIAYDRPHFVHADMTAEEFMEAAQRLGAGGFAEALTGGKRPPPKPEAPKGEEPGHPEPEPAEQKEPAPPAQNPLSGIEGQVRMLEGMLKALGIEDEKRGPAVRRTLKAFMGRMMAIMGPNMGAMLGGGAGKLLIDSRNEVAVERLKEVPEGARSVAIFYGAAHLPDLAKRLEALGYQRVGGRWLLAWDLR
jgi:hypothetical protein